MLFLALTWCWTGVNAQEQLTVYDGTATSSYVPVYGYYGDAYLKCEFVIPATDLAEMENGIISQMAFYLSSVATEAWTGIFQIFLKEVDNATLSAYSGTDGATIVYEGTLDGTQSPMTITFSNNYTYGGGNLLVGVYLTETGNYKSATFLGSEVTGASGQGFSYSSLVGVDFSQKNFVPKTTFTYTPGAAPTCEKPATLEANPVTATSATLSWSGGSGTYNVEVKGGSYADWTAVLEGSSLTTTILTLQPNTSYQVRVQSVCGSETSGYKTASFTTLEVCPDGKVCIGSGMATNSFLPTYTYYNYSLTQQIYTAEELGAAGAIMGIDLYCSGAATRTLDIYLVATSKTSFSGATDWISVSASDLVYSGSVTFAANDWTSIVFDNYFIYDGSSNVALIVDDNTGSYVSAPNFYVFDATSQAIRIYSDDVNYDPTDPGSYNGTVLNVKNRARFLVGTPPACAKPTGLTVSNIAARSANLTWTGSSDEYRVRYRTAAFENGIAEGSFFDDFENGIGSWTIFREGAGIDGTDWRIFNPSTFTEPIDAHSGTNVAMSRSWDSESYAVDNWFISPIVTLDGDLIYGVRDDGVYHEHYDVYVSTTTNEIASFTKIYEPGNASATWTMHSVDLRSYNGVNGYIAFRLTDEDQDYLMIDDVLVGSFIVVPEGAWSPVASTTGTSMSLSGLAPSTSYDVQVIGYCSGSDAESEEVLVSFTTDIACPAPSNLQVLEVNPDGAKLRWKENGEANAWIVAYKEASATDFINVSAQAVDTPYVITGLSSLTEYVVKVGADCGGDGASEWTAEVNFTTLASCPIPSGVAAANIKGHSADISWTGNALNEGYEVSYRTAAGVNVIFFEGFENGIGDWVLEACESSTGIDASAKHSGSNGFRFKYNSNPPQYLISPELTLNEEATLEFFYKNYSGSYAETFQVGFSSTTNSTDAFVWGDEVTASDVQWHSYNAAVPAATKYMAIKYTSNDKYYLYIDDIVIGTPIPAGEWQHATAGSDKKILTGLAPETKYDVVVQGLCAGNVVSDSSEIASFTTIEACVAPSALKVDGVTATTATLAWTEIGDATAWQICLNGDEEHLIAANTNPFTLTGLTAETAYTAKVRANCDISDQSAWSSEINIKTAYGLPFAPAITAIPSDWNRYSGAMSDNVLTSALSSTTSGWIYAASDAGIAAGHFKMNLYSNYMYWIVTPVIDLSEVGASDFLKLSFSAAACKWNNPGVDIPSDKAMQEDDIFAVIVSEDGGLSWKEENMIRWQNTDGADFQLSELVPSGVQYAFNINKYHGKQIRIAFYGASSASGSDFDLHVGKISLTKVNPFNLEINASGYATFYDADNAYLMPDGLTGHAFSIASHLSEAVYGTESSQIDILPADEPVVMKAADGISLPHIFQLVPATSSAAHADNNDLHGVNETSIVGSASDGKAYYVLSLNGSNDSESVGFYYMLTDGKGGFELPAHKAYLVVDDPSLAPSAFFLIDDENNATWLNNLQGVEGTVKFLHEGKIFILREGVIYDATGRQVRKL